MIRTLMASTAIAALLTTGAMAQSQPTNDNQQVQAQSNVDVKTQQGANEELASEWMGQTVYSSAGPDAEQIGDINDLLVDENGDITAAIIGVGGFLGLGEHDVAIPYDQFQITQDQDGEARLVVSMTEEQLENAPEFQREEGQLTYADLRENGGQTGQQQTAENAQTGDTSDSQEMASQDASQSQNGSDQQMAESGQSATPANVAFVQYNQDQNRVSEWLGREVYSSSAQPASGQMNTDTSATGGTSTMEKSSDTAMTNNTGSGSGDTNADTTTMAQSGSQGTAAESGTSMNAQNETMSGDQATGTGTQVATDRQQSIGEIDDIILSDAGQVESVVIDIGGFLGVGEKAVAIPFDEIELARVDNEEEPRLTVAMTRQQLEQAQPFDASQYDESNLASNEQMTGSEGEGTDMAQTGDNEQMNGESAEGTDMAASGQQTTGSASMDGSGEMRTASSKANGRSAERLLGSTVYGSNDENVGEIGDVIVSQKGDVEAIVIDVGGFLGIGEKPVAVEYDTLNVQKDTNGETRYSISATEDQLDGAPTYEENTQ